MEDYWYNNLHKKQFRDLDFIFPVFCCFKFENGHYGLVFHRQDGIIFVNPLEVVSEPPLEYESHLRGMTQLLLNLDEKIRMDETNIQKQIIVLQSTSFESGVLFYLNGVDDCFYMKKIILNNEVIYLNFNQIIVITSIYQVITDSKTKMFSGFAPFELSKLRTLKFQKEIIKFYLFRVHVFSKVQKALQTCQRLINL